MARPWPGAKERSVLLDEIERRLPEWAVPSRAVVAAAAAGALARGNADAERRFAARILPRIDFGAQLREGAQVPSTLYAEAWERRLGYRYLIDRVHRRFRGEPAAEAVERRLGFLERLEQERADVDVASDAAIDDATRSLFARLDAPAEILRHFGDRGDEAAVLDLLARSERRRLFACLHAGFARAEEGERAWILDALAPLQSEATVTEAVEIRAWVIESGSLRTRARLFAELPDLDRRRLLGACEGAVGDFAAGRAADVAPEVAALGRLAGALPPAWVERLTKSVASAFEASGPEGVLKGAHDALARFEHTRRLEEADARALARKGSLYALLGFLADHAPRAELRAWMARAAAMIDADARSSSVLNAVDGAVGAVLAMARRDRALAEDAERLLGSRFGAFRSAAPDLLLAIGATPPRIFRYALMLGEYSRLSRDEPEGLLRLLLRVDEVGEGGAFRPRGRR